MDYAILAKPRMTAAGFAAVLHQHHSPSAPEAAACYKAFVDAGVDPAVGLAVFQHESGFGRYGRALANRSWGNIRHAGAFIAYPTWTAGAADCARLLAVYGRNAIRPGRVTDSTQTFPYVWAPAADGNAPDRYGDAVTAAVAAWAKLYPVVTATKPPAGATGVLRAAGLARLFRLSGGVARAGQATSLHFTAYVGPTVQLEVPGESDRFTFRRILSGNHTGRYVHTSDPGASFGTL